MGIEIALIDHRSPRGFTFVVPRQRRIMVQSSHTMGQIVDQILAMCRPRSLDVIRIEAHGQVEGEFNAIVDRVPFHSCYILCEILRLPNATDCSIDLISFCKVGRRSISDRGAQWLIPIWSVSFVPFSALMLRAIAS